MLVVSAGDAGQAVSGESLRYRGLLVVEWPASSSTGMSRHRPHWATRAALCHAASHPSAPAVKVPEIQVTLQIGDVEVRPGDILVATTTG